MLSVPGLYGSRKTGASHSRPASVPYIEVLNQISEPVLPRARQKCLFCKLGMCCIPVLTDWAGGKFRVEDRTFIEGVRRHLGLCLWGL